MVALVERGAPRDFLDIYHLCQEGFYTPEQCWLLWQQRQQLAGSDTSVTRANMALQTRLARIEQHRPLFKIADPEAKDSAQRVRSWFKTEFTDALIYHLLREWHGLEPLPYLGQELAYIRDDPYLEQI